MAVPIAKRDDYAELRRRIRERGLLDRQPRYYALMLLRTFGLLLLSVALLLVVHNSWIRLLDAAFLALVSAQFGFIGHDAAHRQVFDSPGRNDLLGLLTFDLILGGSLAAWKNKHNQHHSNPNQLDHDPDIAFPIIAFSEEQVARKRGFQRFMVKYQAFFIVPLLTLEWLSLRLSSYRYLILRRPKGALIEAPLVVAHCCLYFGLLIAVLGLPMALLFAAIHHAVLGVQVGAAFAPNHKGMPILDSDSDLDFLRRQVLTARNIKEGRVVDFLTGGLACQIEHHLFPTMPRNNLRRAEPIIKEFCREQSIAYYETGALQSYGEIFRHLHEISAPLRRQ